MNALKNVLFFGLLLAVLCGVYLSLNRQPEQKLPDGLSGDTEPPKVELGMPDPIGAPQPAGNVAGFPSQPPTGMNVPPAASGGMPPPYPAAQSVGATNSTSPFTPPGGVADQSLPPPPSDAPPPSPGPANPFGVANPVTSGSLAAANSASSNSAPPWAGSDRSLAPPPADRSLSSPPAERAAMSSLDVILQQVDLKVHDNKLADALLILSQLYDSPDVPTARARMITEILDQMAARVIYSREHWLEPVYGVRPGDTLDSIADQYQVPSLLLSRINGVGKPQELRPGTSLKVLKGPFSAHVSTARSELTMMLAGRYAGRFPMMLSNDLQQASGLYTVLGKSPPATVGQAGKQWIELSNNTGKIGIEATADLPSAGHGGRSTIWLSERDMDDVYGILSVGSHVVIQR